MFLSFSISSKEREGRREEKRREEKRREEKRREEKKREKERREGKGREGKGREEEKRRRGEEKKRRREEEKKRRREEEKKRRRFLVTLFGCVDTIFSYAQSEPHGGGVGRSPLDKSPCFSLASLRLPLAHHWCSNPFFNT